MVLVKEQQLQKLRQQNPDITQSNIDQQKAALAAQLLGTAQIKAQTDAETVKQATIGRSVGAAAAYTAEQTRLDKARQDSQTLTPQELKDLRDTSTALGLKTQASAQASAQNAADFALQTVFLSDTEKQIAAVNFQLHGNSWKDFMNDGLSSTLRLVDSLKLLKDAAGSFASGLAKDLASGVPKVEALNSALKTLASSVLDAAVKRLVDQALSGLAGALTGAAGGAVAGSAQAATMTTGATSAAGILTSAGATVAASIIGGATEAASILGLTIPPAAATLPVAGATAGTEIGAGGIVAGTAIKAGSFSLAAAMGPIGLAVAAIAAAAALFGLSGSKESKSDTWLKGQIEGMNQRGADIANRSAMVGVDTNTRQGAILAQDAQFVQERIAENKAGGQAMNALLQVQVQERNQLLKDWDQKDTDLIKQNADAKLAIEKAAADRSLGFQDRLFAATNDFTTLQGQLAAFDRTAQQDRAKEAEAGGQALVDLESAQAAERLGIIKTANEKQVADAVQAAKAIADRTLSFQNRLFAAANDNSTLEGQLAAFDRAARQEQLTEVANGGQALVDLEAAQAAERFNVVKTYNDKIVADTTAAAKAQLDAINGTAKSVVDYINGLLSGPGSTYSPTVTKANALAAYNANLVLAQGGNVDAQNKFPQLADNLEKASRAVDASGQAYQDIKNMIISQGLALPAVQATTDPTVQAMRDVLTAIHEQTLSQATDATLIGTIKGAIDAGNAAQVATALSTYFNRIDTNTSQSIDFNEMVAALTPVVTNTNGTVDQAATTAALASMSNNSALRDMFTRLDIDNSGGIDRLELIKAASQATNANAGGIVSNTSTALAKMDGTYLAIDATRVGAVATANNVNSVKGAVDQDRNTLEYSNTIFNAIKALQDTATSQLTLLTAALRPSVVSVSITGSGNTTPGSSPGIPLTLNNQVVDSLNKIVWNTYVIAQNTEYKADGTLAHGHAGGGTYATGGVIPAYGLGLVSEHLNPTFLRAGPEPITVSPFAPALSFRPGNDNSNAALLAEVRALREEVTQLRKENNDGLDRQTRMTGAVGEHIREGVDDLNDTQQDLVRETKFKRAS
jgi:hypothetical protein